MTASRRDRRRLDKLARAGLAPDVLLRIVPKRQVFSLRLTRSGRLELSPRSTRAGIMKENRHV